MEQRLECLTAVKLAESIRSKQISSVETTNYFLNLIDNLNFQTNSFVTVTHDLAIETAKKLDRDLANGKLHGVLHGVPVGIKDLGDAVAGVKSTFGSLPLRNFVPQHTAAYVQQLVNAGAIIVGKTNSPEFGHKGITDNYVTGPTSTPFDLTRNAGGSSGGSAAAVGAGMVPIAQGSDGGGSVRIPAAWCGVYGIKPSFGRISEIARPNAFALSSPFVGIGPLARTVDDAALMLSVMQGSNSGDPFSLPNTGENYSNLSALPFNRIKIAYSPDMGGFPIDNEVKLIVEKAINNLERAGAEIKIVNIVMPKSIFKLSELWVRLMALLFSDVMQSFKEVGFDLIKEYKDQLSPEFYTLVTKVFSTSAIDTRADQILRTQVYDALITTMSGFDFLLSPTLALSPIKNQPDGLTRVPASINGIPIEPSIGWCLTFPFNFSGHPAASIPCGFTKSGLPVGLQIVGNRHRDDQVLALSKSFETLMPWYDKYPFMRII
jgi:amidase/aspartyl-tRNA(Asn)/glutamyl-tRNA(Gln) amidotransferase subunit A